MTSRITRRFRLKRLTIVITCIPILLNFRIRISTVQVNSLNSPYYTPILYLAPKLLSICKNSRQLNPVSNHPVQAPMYCIPYIESTRTSLSLYAFSYSCTAPLCSARSTCSLGAQFKAVMLPFTNENGNLRTYVRGICNYI